MEMLDLAIQYGKAWAARDLDAIMALHTEDTIFQIHADDGAPATGSSAVREAFGAVLARSPDLRFERKRVSFGDAHFVSEYVMSGTVDGKHFVCDGVDVIAVKDGRVARKDSYADWVAYARQVGMQLTSSKAG